MKEKLREHILTTGADLVGFADITQLQDQRYSGYNIAISIAVKLFDAVVDTIQEGPTYMYLHHYEATNRKIDTIVLDVGAYLEGKGFDVFPVAASQLNPQDPNNLTSFFSHKTAARLSGLGHIGKSALMVTKAYGPRVRFGTLLVKMPIEADQPIEENLCGQCRICKIACPANAIKGNHYQIGSPRDSLYDAHQCQTYMKNNFAISGGGKICGICIQRCPLGRK